MNFPINYLQRDFSVSRSVIAENWKNDAVATIKSDQSRNTSSQGKKKRTSCFKYKNVSVRVALKFTEFEKFNLSLQSQ